MRLMHATICNFWEDSVLASNYDAKESGDLTRVVVFWDTKPV